MKTLPEAIHDLAAKFCSDRNRVFVTPTVIEAAMLEAAALAYQCAAEDALRVRERSNLPD